LQDRHPPSAAAFTALSHDAPRCQRCTAACCSPAFISSSSIVGDPAGRPSRRCTARTLNSPQPSPTRRGGRPPPSSEPSSTSIRCPLRARSAAAPGSLRRAPPRWMLQLQRAVRTAHLRSSALVRLPKAVAVPEGSEAGPTQLAGLPLCRQASDWRVAPPGSSSFSLRALRYRLALLRWRLDRPHRRCRPGPRARHRQALLLRQAARALLRRRARLVPRGGHLQCAMLSAGLSLMAQLKRLCLQRGLACLRHKHLLQPVRLRNLPQARHQRLPACLRSLPAQHLHRCLLASLTLAHQTARWW